MLAVELVAVVVLAITANTLYPFSDVLPDWSDLRAQAEDYFEEPTGPVKVDGKATVHYIDVGQGSCVLIKMDGHAILLDAGENDQGEHVTDYIRRQGIEKLDYVVASHPHSDHIGGMDVVLSNIPADHLIMPELKASIVPTTRTYEDLIRVVEEKQIDVIASEVGAEYEVGEGKITLLGPTGDFDGLNDMSVGVRFQFGETAFLYTGDMEKKAEQALLATGETLKADVYAMGHHGSKTSNDEKLLDRIDAKYFVVQAGYDNEYRHPHKEALERVLDRGGTLYRTDLNGTVIFSTDGTELTVTPERT